MDLAALLKQAELKKEQKRLAYEKSCKEDEERWEREACESAAFIISRIPEKIVEATIEGHTECFIMDDYPSSRCVPKVLAWCAKEGLKVIERTNCPCGDMDDRWYGSWWYVSWKEKVS